MLERDLRGLKLREQGNICSVAAAVIGGVASVGSAVYSGSQAKKGAKATANSADAATAEGARQFDYIQQQNAPFRQLGLTASQAVANSFGLPVSMTTPAPANTNAQPAPSGVSMTGTGGAVGRSFAGYSPAVPDTGQGVTLPAQAPSMTGSTIPMSSGPAGDWGAYLRDNPDVATSAKDGWLSTVNTGDLNADGRVDATDKAIFHYQGYGQKEGRVLPTTAAPTGPAPGYIDPTAPKGYTMPDRPMTAPLDVSLSAYQKSPGYDFRLGEGYKALDHVAAAGGGLMSGARLKAAQRYGQDFATNDYSNWRDYTTGQYNLDRSRSDGLYQDDRNFLTSRYDTRNNQLMQLAGFGSAANASNAAAAQSYAQNVGNNLMTAGAAKAGGYINSANAINSGVNNLMTAGTYLAGKSIGGGFGSTGGYGGYNFGLGGLDLNMAW